MSTTRPDAAARIGVPEATPMSMPGWQDSHARRSQNGDVIGPLTGQIRPPEPGLTGPAGSELLPRPASLAWILRCALTRTPTSSCSWWRRLATLAGLWRRHASGGHDAETYPAI